MNEAPERDWHGIWIRAELAVSKTYKMPPAPKFREKIICNAKPQSMQIFLSGLGYHELYINGRKADKRVLAPVVMQYDVHAPYIEYNAEKLIHKGENIIEVIVGHGYFFTATDCAWRFKSAPWKPDSWEAAKMICDVVADGVTIAKSDYSWEYSATPIVFNSLRNGEYYDARLENQNPEWQHVVSATPPPGILRKEALEPCRICEEILPVLMNGGEPGVSVYDTKCTMTGWAKIAVRGKAGATVTIRYGEMLNPDGSLNQKVISRFIFSGEIQTDRYILSGSFEPETWSPRFTYHGFRYIQVEIDGEAEYIHNDFQKVGTIQTDSQALNSLQEITMNSYLSNFTGIPTDCPHREKNGWTGDANIASATGLWNYDARKAYLHFLQMVCDTQKSSGMVASIAPTSGWGYNVNPPWDAILFDLPDLLNKFYDDTTAIENGLPVMEKYWNLLNSMSLDNIIPRHGLGDWLSPVGNEVVMWSLLSSCYFYRMTNLLFEFTGKEFYKNRAQEILSSIRVHLRNPDGTWADKTIASRAIPIYFGITEDPETEACLLVEQVRENKHLANFGLFGSKFVPRVLADHGYIDDALELFLQPNCPGWGYFVRTGATALWETWDGGASRDHIMFGDCSAWMYEYLAGFKPGMELISPQFPKRLNHLKACYQGLTMEWTRQEDIIQVEISIPPKMKKKCTLHLPNGERYSLITGKQKYSVR